MFKQNGFSMFCTKHKTLFCGDLPNQFVPPLYIVQALLLYLFRIVGLRVIGYISQEEKNDYMSIEGINLIVLMVKEDAVDEFGCMV